MARREEIPMARRFRAASQLQNELLRLLMPRRSRLEDQVSERVRPRLAEVGRTMAGRPAAQILSVLESVVRAAGATPDMKALEEFAQDIHHGENPFV
jgi:hypothetical protein